MTRIGRLAVPGVLVLTLLLAGSLRAQPAAKAPAAAAAARPASPLGPHVAEMLSAEPVQKEIKLTDEQKQKLKAEDEAFKKTMRAEYSAFASLRDVPADDPRLAEAGEKLNKLGAQHLKDLEAILTPEQVEQLKQINAQIQAWMGSNNPQVVERLGVTEKQAKQLAEIRQGAESQIWMIVRDAAKKTQETLTPEQREAVVELLQPSRPVSPPVLKMPRRPSSATPAPAK
jgi:Spy/CpxP family protein refolding chaperone